jgi:hypothetical protein
MLGIDVAQSTVAKYMARAPRRTPSQGSKTFLRIHAAGIDRFAVRTISFQLLYGLAILHHGRGRLMTATSHPPTAEWLARQVTEAFPWNEAPRHLNPLDPRPRWRLCLTRCSGAVKTELLDTEDAMRAWEARTPRENVLRLYKFLNQLGYTVIGIDAAIERERRSSKPDHRNSDLTKKTRP